MHCRVIPSLYKLGWLGALTIHGIREMRSINSSIGHSFAQCPAFLLCRDADLIVPWATETTLLGASFPNSSSQKNKGLRWEPEPAYVQSLPGRVHLTSHVSSSGRKSWPAKTSFRTQQGQRREPCKRIQSLLFWPSTAEISRRLS